VNISAFGERKRSLRKEGDVKKEKGDKLERGGWTNFLALKQTVADYERWSSGDS